MRLVRTTLKALSAAAFIGAMATAYAAETTVEERLKPVGELCMAGEDCAATTMAAAGAGEARSGEAVYTTGCAACHSTGAAGAPKLGDTAAWAVRLEKGKETLYKNAFNGFNAMPAKGLCADCTEDEIKASVDHMLSASGH